MYGSDVVASVYQCKHQLKCSTFISFHEDSVLTWQCLPDELPLTLSFNAPMHAKDEVSQLLCPMPQCRLTNNTKECGCVSVVMSTI